ncbi:hypothetical protein [Deinococcus marmoris]|uniref:hypothetical protein n=1 Tax=Deinococcus marmoris TaxID=249408 RepID=UPI0011151D57|nr:hypothetical protein [Deinococcus marmoris]
MTYRLHLARHPSNLTAPQALIIQDFLKMAGKGQRTCLRAVVEMCADLHQNGRDCRYLKSFGGPVYELKKRASDGGARVYVLAIGAEFVLVHAECKNENQADQNLLLDVSDVYDAIMGHQPVLEPRRS